MAKILSELKYAVTHEWARQDGDGLVTVGITDHAQDLLGDIVYVELPNLRTHLHVGDECGVVESVKAASDIYSPVAGEVVEVNQDLQTTPGLINEAPYHTGWILRIRLSNPEDYEKLLDAKEYEDKVQEEH